MKKNRVKLNSKQLALLKMIHVLSNGKDYLIIDQLMKFLLLFTYNTESAARMAMKELEDLGMIEKVDKETTNYKHVFLTYKGALHLDFDQKKKPEYHPTTEDTITRRVEMLYVIAVKFKETSFDGFLSKLNDKYYSTLFMSASATVFLTYQKKLDKLHAEAKTSNSTLSAMYWHKEKLQWERGYLENNLRDTPAKLPEQSFYPNLVELTKKNIYLENRQELKGGTAAKNTYVKILNYKVPYTFKKFIRDLTYLAKLNDFLFPRNSEIQFKIIAQGEKEKEVIEAGLKIKEFENKEQEMAYEKYKDCVAVKVLDVDHYLIRKDKYDAS